jgi:4-aminobutyrate aminotransferase/(S)-3-amino-2-methylpropionate transaminase
MDALDPGGLGSTWRSPIGCAAALAVREVIEEEGLCARAAAIGGACAPGRSLAAAGLPVANIAGWAPCWVRLTNAAGETDGAVAKAVTAAATRFGADPAVLRHQGEIRVLVR